MKETAENFMGKKIKLREARKRAAEAAIFARLHAHSRADAGPAFITAFGQFAPAYRCKVEEFRGLALRSNTIWTPGDNTPVGLREGPFGRVTVRGYEQPVAVFQLG